MKRKTIVAYLVCAAACTSLLSGCRYVADPQPMSTATVCTFASVNSSSESQTSSTTEVELDSGVYIVDGIPYWNKADKKPLLEVPPATSEGDERFYTELKAFQRRWIGQGGKPYHLKVLSNTYFTIEALEQQTQEDAERLWFTIFSDYGEKVLEECSPEDRDALLGLGLDTETLIYLLNLDEVTPELLLSLSEAQKEALVELYTPITETKPKMEEMGMIYPRRSMTGTKECLLLVLSQPSDEEFRQQAKEQNIPHWMQDELLRRGNMRSEILAMTEEEREKALTPAINDYLHSNICNELDEEFWLTEAGISFLNIRYGQVGGMDECRRLELLGYTYYDKVTISDEELEFLFPLEELPDKLNQYGFSDEEIARYETRLKYIVREALEVKRMLE